jgi:hypothetical protein
MKIGFDFDKIFVNYPVFLPETLVNFLYKNHNGKLSYRIPGRLEQRIRIFTHNPTFRQPIKKNMQVLENLASDPNQELYLISGRFGFLKQTTENWINKYSIHSLFKELHFNFENEQPHLEKDRIIKKIGIQKFVDDDNDLLTYLAKKNPSVEFYWLDKKDKHLSLPTNITPIKDLVEFQSKYLDQKTKPVIPVS